MQSEHKASYYNVSVLSELLHYGFWDKEATTVCLAVYLLALQSDMGPQVNIILSQSRFARQFFSARDEVCLSNSLTDSSVLIKIIHLALRKNEVQIAKRAGEDLIALNQESTAQNVLDCRAIIAAIQIAVTEKILTSPKSSPNTSRMDDSKHEVRERTKELKHKNQREKRHKLIKSCVSFIKHFIKQRNTLLPFRLKEYLVENSEIADYFS